VGLGGKSLTWFWGFLWPICHTPAINAIIHEDYRRGLVRRFPYAVFYDHDDGKVTVYGVFHTSRDPSKWRRRLS